MPENFELAAFKELTDLTELVVPIILNIFIFLLFLSGIFFFFGRHLKDMQTTCLSSRQNLLSHSIKSSCLSHWEFLLL